MFKRPEQSYNIDQRVILNILKDEVNPLRQIVSQIPQNSKIFDVGAGNGLLGQLFRVTDKTVYIDGLEPNTYASKIAKEYYRKFFNGYLSSFIEELRQESYDYIVLADVIEHVVDPIEFINQIKSIMNDDTKLIFSIPNVAFGSMRVNFLFGKFQYTDSGILEKTHLRFYTNESMHEMMNFSELYIEKCFYLHRDMFYTETSQFLNQITLTSLCEIMSDKFSEVYQFLIVVNKNRKTEINYIDIGKKKRNCYLRWMKFKIVYLLKTIKKMIKKVLDGN